MGETYRGLTIRFGGDTSSLQRALKSANAAISSTQSELRKVNSALKFDPADVVALNVKMELLKERSQGAYEKIETLRKSLEQYGSSPEELSKLASSFDAVGKSVSEAQTQFDSFDHVLAKTKDQIDKLAEKNGLDRVFTENGRKEIEGMTQAFAEQVKGGDELNARYRELQSEWGKASEELDTAKEKAKLQDLAAEFIKVTSEVKQLREEYIKLAGKSIFNEQEATRYNEKLKELDASLEMVEDNSKKLQDALQLRPNDLETAALYVKSLADEYELLDSKSNALKERMDALKKSMPETFDTTKVSAREARAEFVRCAEELAKWDDLIGKAESDLSEMTMEANRLIKKGESNTDEYKNLEAQIKKAKNELIELRQEQDKVQEKFNMAQAVTELKQLETQERECATRAATLKDRLDNLGQSAKINASTFTTLGMALSQNITPNIMIAASYSVEAAKEIDAAYRDMRKTVNGTEEDFENLRQAAMNFASQNVTSADQILEIQAMGGQMGLLVDELETFSVVVANLNVATNIEDASEMAEILGQLSNILSDLNQDTMPSFGDALVRLGNNNAALESDILDVTSRIGSMGSICEFTTPQLLAWATAIAATGQNAEAAGTAISKTMSDIEGAVGEGGDALEAFAEVSGMTADEFADKWNNAPSEAMQKFILGLKRIDQEGGSVDNTLENLGITAVRQKQALEGLTQTVDTLDDALTMSQDAWDGVSDQWGDAGDAANEAQKKAEGFSGQLAILTNNAQMLGAEFAESLAPVLQVVNTVLQTTYEIVKDMPDSLKLVILGITGLVAAIGPIATIIGPFATAIKTINSDSSKMNRTMGEAATGISKAEKTAKTAKTAFAALGVAIASIIIIEVISYLANLYSQCKKLENATDGLENALSDAEKSFKASGSAAQSSGVKLVDYTSKISKLSNETKEAISRQSDLADSIRDTWSGTLADISLAEKYQTTMSELAGNVDGNISKYNELKLAVEGYNEITGSSIEITDSNTGSLSLNSDQIAANTKEWEKNAKIQALQEAIRDTYKEQIQTQARINELLEARNNLNNEYSPYMTEEQLNSWNRELSDVDAEISKNVELISSQNKAIDNYVNAAKDATDGTDDFSSALGRAAIKTGQTQDAFISWAKSLGIATQEGIDSMVAAIDTGIDPTMAAVLQITGMTKTEFENAATSIGISGEDAVTRFKGAIEAGTEPTVAAAMTITGTTLEQFTYAANAMGYSGEEGVYQFAQNVLNGEGEARTAAQTVANEAKSGLESVSTESAGKNFISGFIDTLKDWRDTAYTEGYYLGEYGSRGLNDGMDAHSPSRKAQKAAYNFAKLGFIDTVAKYENEAYITAKRLGQSSVSGINASILSLRDAAQSSVQATLEKGTAASNVSNTTNNSSTTNIVLNITADSSTTLDNLIEQAKRAKMAYR